VFGRAAMPSDLPEVDKQSSTTPADSFRVEDVVKSRSLPLVHDDRPRYNSQLVVTNSGLGKFPRVTSIVAKSGQLSSSSVDGIEAKWSGIARRSSTKCDRPRYSPSPCRRLRSPCTPPPPGRRPVRAPPSPPVSTSRRAWESLRAPADAPPPSSVVQERAVPQAPAALPEPEYLYRRFVDESTTQDTTTTTDTVDEVVNADSDR